MDPEQKRIEEDLRGIVAGDVLCADADRRLYASIGIGFGDILVLADEDLFGDEVNLASKLGEDVAQGGMVLLTEAARAELDPSVPTTPERVSVSGLALVYHALA